MKPENSQLIETAVRPLADDAEMKLAGTQLLEEMHIVDSGDTDALFTRWNEVDSKKFPQLWRKLLLVFLLIASGMILTIITRQGLNVRRAYGMLNGTMSGSSPQFQKPGKANLTTEQRLLLNGDESKHSRADRVKTLWDLHPENPAYFSEYAAAYLSENDNLPADFLEVARKIAPKNAWFLYLAAGDAANEAVKRKKQSPAAKAAKEAAEWEILKPAQLDTAIRLFHEARDLPEFDDYKTEMMRKKIPLLKQENQVERVISMSYLAGLTASDLLQIRMIGNSVAAKLGELAKENKTAEFKSLMADTEAYNRKSLSVEPSTLIACLVVRVNVSNISQALADGARKLGLHTKTQKFQAISDTIIQNRKKVKPDVKINGVEFRRKSGFIAGLSTPILYQQAEHPPAIAETDVKPGRMIDYEDLSMLCAVVSFFLLGIIFVFVWAFRFRQGNLIQRLAQRMESLLGRPDWLWIIVGGIVLPFTFVAGINRLTPLGGQDLSIYGLNFILPTAQFVALVFLLIIMPILIARWRIGKQSAVFGFKWKRPWLGWATVTSAASYVVLIGFVALHASVVWIVIASLLLLFPMLWMLAVGLGAVIAKRPKLLMSATVARLLIPVYATAMLMMILLVPVFKAAEQYWFEQDTFMILDPAQPGMGTYEYRVAVQLQKETRELLTFKP